MNERLLVILALLVTVTLAVSTSVSAEPATEESLQALEATVTQSNMLTMIIAHVVTLILGFMAGQQR
ncbi:hypothetical protein [uncultured Methylophaga sp.]|uniref:hypothetical protein n=1 Tax=uncultured Methylophaga sp. TaxID=285271 RepID=UPI0026169BE9|nr:hypothetical protein [uncultured Methylophaga sp.]